ncbi:MAG: hypothetical protein R2770_00640 [Acidimicrobiales bacterium]
MTDSIVSAAVVVVGSAGAVVSTSVVVELAAVVVVVDSTPVDVDEVTIVGVDPEDESPEHPTISDVVAARASSDKNHRCPPRMPD